MYKRLGATILLSLILVFVCLLPVQATGSVAPPDGATAAITQIWASQNILETGDLFIHFLYQIPYATPPTEDVNACYQFNINNPTDTVLLGRANIYAYHESGYNFGVGAFYFTPATNVGWSLPYVIHIAGDDTKLSSPFDLSFTMTAANYSAKTIQAEVQAEVREKILSIAHTLESKWTLTLTDEADVGTVLNTKGELYFRNAIPLLQYICPGLFYFQISDPFYPTPTFSTTYGAGIENQFNGTWVGTSLAGAGGMFSVSTQLIGAIAVVVLCIVVTGISVRKLQSINSGLMDSFTIVIVSASLGIFPFGLQGLIVYLCWAWLGYLIIFRR